ncbi:hypothetical protein RHMOL_Rhmol09G0134200 [Rhododendron molle]|uniref:Uncharacterized protein n=2 Tax=Rhododendron molle TaxID=49168 RepID=A0ACC0ME77_RHOML|nr:hypothetical protein RHMOL_Rhmol09G0134200 [Rhododendron molle]
MSFIYKLAMAGTVYYIWKAKNDIVFRNKQYTSDAIYDILVKDIRDRASSWRNYGRITVNRVLCRVWNILEHIL